MKPSYLRWWRSATRPVLLAIFISGASGKRRNFTRHFAQG